MTPAARALLAVSLLLLSGCGAGTLPAPTAAVAATEPPVSAPKPTATYFLHFLDTGRIEPDTLHGHPGQLIKLVLVGGQRKHDLTSPGLSVNIDVPPGQVEVIAVELPRTAGTYAFWSAQPGDRQAGMEGRLIVERRGV